LGTWGFDGVNCYERAQEVLEHMVKLKLSLCMPRRYEVVEVQLRSF